MPTTRSRGPDGRTVPLWATWLGQPRRGGNDIDMFATNDPEWGILSTPVISDDRKTLYVVAWHDDGAQGIRYKLHALDLASGAETRPAAVIMGSSTDASQPCNTAGSFNPCKQKQRAALLLSDGVLYIGLGGDGSRGAAGRIRRRHAHAEGDVEGHAERRRTAASGSRARDRRSTRTATST